MRTLQQNRKGQLAVAGLLFAFMLIAIAAIIQGPLLDFINIGVNETLEDNGTHSDLIVTVVEILPVFIWLVVLIAVVALITGSAR